MKKLFLLLIPIILLTLCGCSSVTEDCQNYAEGYCNASIGVAHYPKTEREGVILICKFNCAEIVLTEETKDF